MGGDTLPPTRESFGDRDARGSTATNPKTRNPGANELTFQPAREARSVAERLQAYRADTTASPLSLSSALRQAQRGGREFLNAQEEYLLAAIRVLIERHLWGPRFFNDTSATLAGSGDDGDFEHALSVVNTLRATQRLPSGGEVEARWVLNATEQLRETAGGRYRQSSSIVLSGNIPLLKGAGDVAREDLIQTERNLVYAARRFERFRREYLVSICADFFSLAQTRQQITNQERQIESLKRLETSTAARVEAGRLDAFQTSIASSRVLAGEATLAGLRERYTLQRDRFKVRLGLGPDDQIEVKEIDLDIPDPEMSPEAAGTIALDLRLDLQNRRDQIEDARRGVANARDALLPDLNLTGSLTVPTDPDDKHPWVSQSPDDARYSVGALLSLPLDREQERLRLRSSMIALTQREREYDQARDDVVVRVRSALRNVGVARFQLDLAEKQVEINRRRLEGQQLKADQLDPQQLVDSFNELLDAENNRDRARTDLRTAILNYLLESDQIRVDRDGTFKELPGME